jgi:replicative superfamily II helicase
LEQLAQTDKRRIASRSILRKELAKEIAQELQELRNQNSAERARLMREKEEILRRETQEQERQSKRDDRLEQIKLKLKKLRRSNGDY